MKKVIIIFMCAFLSECAFSQVAIPPGGVMQPPISTDPRPGKAFNPELDGRKQNGGTIYNADPYFNWLTTQWFWYDVRLNGGTQKGRLRSPFYDPMLTDLNYRLAYDLDMAPEDGWELVKTNFGLKDIAINGSMIPDCDIENSTCTETAPDNLNPFESGTEEVWFALYNRYTGVFRVVATLKNAESYNNVIVRLRYFRDDNARIIEG